MTARRKAAGIAALGLAPLALSLVTAAPAAAHGSMTDPVSRVAACFAEGPEHPQTPACKALVETTGTQPLYDWNEVNLANAAGRHKEIIPDGQLCSAGRAKYKGLDAPRTDWPASRMSAGAHTFRYKATAPHPGTIAMYVTRDGYDPSKPLKWSDLEAEPFAKVKNPKLVNGAYVFDGTVPQRSGRHLIYSTWQRSDSTEAFYTCSDVDFSGTRVSPQSGSPGSAARTDGAGGPEASVPSEKQFAEGADKSTVDHGGHGGDSHQGHGSTGNTGNTGAPGNTAHLARTGGDNSSATVAVGSAAALAAGAGVVFTALRRRAGSRV